MEQYDQIGEISSLGQTFNNLGQSFDGVYSVRQNPL